MKRRYFLVPLVLLAAIAVVAGVMLLPDGEEEEPPLALAPAATATVTPRPLPSATASPVPPSPAPTELVGQDVSRIVIPSLGIDAPIVVLGVDAEGTMLSPDNPIDVAWYDFSGRPGEGSNIVMAGHLDYVNYGPAVFYRLRDAEGGQEVHLVLADGSLARYRVLDVTSYDEATAPVMEIVGPTEDEIVTLITCGGSFDPRSREYDKRVVVRAARISEA